MKDRHVLEALGKAYVVVEDGHVVEVGEPLIERCPIFAKARGIEEITQEVVCVQASGQSSWRFLLALARLK